MIHSLRWGALIYGKEPHHLDHLGPLCAFLSMPLIVTEEEIASSAKIFYPSVECILASYLTAPEFIVSHFDTIFYCTPRDLFDEVFFFAQELLQKRVRTIWCPHGNSDKGRSIYFMEGLHKERAALVYGKQMIDFLKLKKVFDQLEAHAIIGNYRYAFYLQHKSFYDQLVEEHVLRHLPPARRTILYAPTWQDYERSASFFQALPHLATPPPDVRLLIKLHPNTLEQKDPMIEALLEKLVLHPRIHILLNFPPVYPLLNVADIYIGDMSSIGYDFLTFDRPLFFLNPNERDAKSDPGLYLFRCGREIRKEEYARIYEIIDDYFHFEVHPFSQIRKEVYAYAFGHDVSLEELKKRAIRCAQ